MEKNKKDKMGSVQSAEKPDNAKGSIIVEDIKENVKTNKDYVTSGYGKEYASGRGGISYTSSERGMAYVRPDAGNSYIKYWLSMH